MSKDPLGFGSNEFRNLYQYAKADPANYYDPPGKQALAGAAPVAGVVSQLDSPLPGPADAIAAGILICAAAVDIYWWATSDDDKKNCKFVREVYYSGPTKQCWYSCPGYGAPVVFAQHKDYPCPGIGANGLVDTSQIVKP